MVNNLCFDSKTCLEKMKGYIYLDWSKKSHKNDPKSLKLDTFIRLRWFVVLGQISAVLVVHFGLSFKLNLIAIMLVVSLSACLNIFLRYKYPHNHRIEEASAAALLAYDIFQLATLLYLTGGLHNPFISLFIAPVLISSTILSPKHTQILGIITVIIVTFLAFFHEPLPWSSGTSLSLPPIYVLGVWFSAVISLAFIGLYAWRLSEEARQLSTALAETEFVLAREQHISTLDGLAAAAAHQLGTPLATITLIANELDKSLNVDGPLKSDITILKQQAARCREILGNIASLGDETIGPLDIISIEHLIEEISAPHRSFGITISVICAGKGDMPNSARNAGVLYGLGNLIENAIDFAQSTILILASWTQDEVRIIIRDDGEGFDRDVLSRLGDPYISTRRMSTTEPNERSHGGLGLGLFIAKTLLERSGAQFDVQNALPPDHGAIITIIWPRRIFEAEIKAYGT
jgi:two-component system, sensor histidine kinase RegB